MRFLNGEILWNLFWVLPLFFLVFYFGWRRRDTLLRRFLGKRAGDPSYTSVSGHRRFWRAVILAGALVLLFVAAARPSWGVSIQPYTGQGRDIMVVFDTSRSMLAQDVRPSRLEHAKWLVRELVKRNPGDRFGLIAFAGQAFLECPLTIDKTSFLASLNDLSTDTIPVGGTNIEQALATAVKGFRAAETSHRAVLLITDGDELYGDSGKAVGEIVKLKIPLFVADIGDPSQPSLIQVPSENGGLRTLKDAQGNPVKSPLNERALSTLAQKTGGIYVRSTTTDSGLSRLEARIGKLARQEIDSGKQTRPIERPVYPLAGAFLLLCLWFCLSEKRMSASAGRSLLLFGLLFAGLHSFGAENAPLPGPEPAPSAQETAPATVEEKSDATPVELYNEGLKAQSEEKDAQKALTRYEQAIGSAGDNREVRAKSYQNLGVLHHQQARSVFDKAQQTLAAQQLDAALQEVDQTLKQIAATQDIYREALRESADSSAVSRNQQLLLIDRKKAEELKKKIEDLKKQQQQARENTQQAKNQQQQQNQQQNQQDQQQNQQQNQQQDQQQNQQQNQQDQQQNQQQNQQNQQKQNQQKQDQQQNQQNQQKQNQQKQDQQQDQQKQDQQQDQQQNQQQDQQQNQQQNQQDQQQNQQDQKDQAKQQTEKARESAQKLQDQARELNQKNLEDQAKKAKEELDKARQAQEENKGKEAEEHLKKALEQLGGSSDQKDQKDQNKDQKDQNKDQKDQNKDQKDQNKDQKDQNKDQKDQNKDQKDQKDRELPKESGEQPRPQEEEDNKDIDKNQARALLDLMSNDEKLLKDELKDRMKRARGIRPVEKDW